MQNLLLAIQIVFGVALIFLVLLQVKGVGLGRVWGSWGNSFSRMGIDSLVFKITFFAGFVFLVVSILQLI